MTVKTKKIRFALALFFGSMERGLKAPAPLVMSRRHLYGTQSIIYVLFPDSYAALMKKGDEFE